MIDMNWQTIALLAGVAIVPIVLYIFFRSAPATFTKVAIGDTYIQAEMADTIPKQIKGLMFRKSLPEQSGMLFNFSSDGYHGIWMMNMSISLDIIWINSDHTIVSMVKDAKPCMILCPVYRPSEPAKYVLEVNSGFTDKYGIQIGDKVKF